MASLPLIYSGLIGLTLFFSGLPALHPKASSIDTRYIVAFASGVIVAAAMFEMIPEADVATNWPYLGIGFFAFYLLERAVMVHSCGQGECKLENVNWITLIGMSADNFTDGVAIGVSYFVNPVLGFFVMIAIIVHEIPQSLTIAFVMKEEKYTIGKILGTLLVGAILYPMGSLMAGFFPSFIYNPIVAVVAGEFIFIGAGELLPEAHKKLDFQVIISVILGAVFVLALELFL